MSVGSSIVGALRVVLGADTAQLDTALKDSSAKLKGFGTAAVAAGNVAAQALAQAANQISAAVNQALGTAGKLASLSQSLGLSVEALSALKFAAQESGKSLEQLGDGLKNLSQRMVEAVADNRSDPARVFAALGVQVRDATGQMRNAGDVFVDLAAKFKSFANGPAKVALAEQLGLGELIPLLNKGSDGIGGLMDEAKRLGLVISTDTAVAAKQFRRQLDDLGESNERLVLVVSARLAPALQQVNDRLQAWTRDAAQSSEKTALLTGTFKALVTTIEIAAAGLASIQLIFSNFWASIKANENAETVIARNAQMWDQLKSIWSSGASAIAAVWNDWAPTVQKAADETGKALAPIRESTRAMEDRFATALASLNAFVSAPTQNFAEKMVAIEQAVSSGMIKARDEINLTKQVWEQLRAEQRATLNDLLNTPTETLVAKMQAVRDALAQGTINTREFGQMTKKINDENVGHWEALAGATSNTIAAMFKDNKAAAIGAALINTATAVTKNLATYPWPFGAVMAGLAAAAGAAQVAAIKSTSLSGGGATPRPASAPSVSAAAAAQQSGGTPANLPGQTLTVTGIRADDLFSGEAVRRLAEKLLDYQKNGGTVVFQGR